MSVSRIYTVATILIIAGLVALCQPFSLTVHFYAFPVFLLGVVLFMILDHLPGVGENERLNP
jgi:hypothetical protein